MPDLDAYRRSQQPHSHDWQPLTADVDWCPPCGATRRRPDPDDGVVTEHREETA